MQTIKYFLSCQPRRRKLKNMFASTAVRKIIAVGGKHFAKLANEKKNITTSCILCKW